VFGLVHLWIRIQFSPPFSWNYGLLQIDQKAPEMLGKRVSGNQFFKIFWGRATGSTDFNQVLPGKRAI